MSGNVEESALAEFRSVNTLVPEHAFRNINDFNATGMLMGRLMHFSRPRIEFKRFIHSNTDARDYKPAVSRKNPVHPVHRCE